MPLLACFALLCFALLCFALLACFWPGRLVPTACALLPGKPLRSRGGGGGGGEAQEARGPMEGGARQAVRGRGQPVKRVGSRARRAAKKKPNSGSGSPSASYAEEPQTAAPHTRTATRPRPFPDKGRRGQAGRQAGRQKAGAARGQAQGIAHARADVRGCLTLLHRAVHDAAGSDRTSSLLAAASLARAPPSVGLKVGDEKKQARPSFARAVEWWAIVAAGRGKRGQAGAAAAAARLGARGLSHTPAPPAHHLFCLGGLASRRRRRRRLRRRGRESGTVLDPSFSLGRFGTLRSVGPAAARRQAGRQAAQQLACSLLRVCRCGPHPAPADAEDQASKQASSKLAGWPAGRSDGVRSEPSVDVTACQTSSHLARQR
ncbi:uncharacterized protein PSFLO_04602 [Pseudozyma flocculosa]|uniref:Uncharacterized protein n=1 Tax=Pseudozyma flocculosa TaxID=84751 RepID=A0A5C3F3P8_9BASI|nr:uncharacterized protein PSFLO_04602 [Pseudozyma flocculosa]